MKTLVIAGFGIGDVLSTVPLIRNLKTKLTDNKVYLLNEQVAKKNREGRQLLKDCSYVDGYVQYRRFEFRKDSGVPFFKLRAAIGSVVDFFKLIALVRKESFDVVIDSWPGTRKTALFSFLSGAKTRLGYKHNPFSSLYTKAVGADTLTKPEADSKFVESLGGKVSKTDLYLETFVDYGRHTNRIKKILSGAGIGRDLVVGFNIGRDDDLGRRWPAENWIAVGNWLAKEKKAGIVLLGDKDSTKGTKEVADGIDGKVVNIAGRLSVEETLAAIKQCDIMLSINNGLMHMATAMKVPMVTLAGPSLHGWDPYSGKTITIRGISPQRCDEYRFECARKGRPCWDYCMRIISTKKIVYAINKLLRRI